MYIKWPALNRVNSKRIIIILYRSELGFLSLSFSRVLRLLSLFQSFYPLDLSLFPMVSIGFWLCEQKLLLYGDYRKSIAKYTRNWNVRNQAKFLLFHRAPNAQVISYWSLLLALCDCEIWNIPIEKAHGGPSVEQMEWVELIVIIAFCVSIARNNPAAWAMATWFRWRCRLNRFRAACRDERHICGIYVLFLSWLLRQ